MTVSDEFRKAYESLCKAVDNYAKSKMMNPNVLVTNVYDRNVLLRGIIVMGLEDRDDFINIEAISASGAMMDIVISNNVPRGKYFLGYLERSVLSF